MRQVPSDWYYQSLKIDSLQRFWHQRRFAVVSGLVEPVKGEVLDIGCADGTFSKIIFEKSKADFLMGIDISKSFVAWANRHWGKKMKFRVGDAQELKFPDQSFSAVFVLEVLEHVQKPLQVLMQIKKVLKKGGYALLLVPTDSFLFCIIWWLWLKFYPRGWVWREAHIQTYRNNYLPILCRRAGFTIEENKKFLLGMLQVVKIRK